jgi:hypothetical protein
VCIVFKANINNQQFRKGGEPHAVHEHYLDINFDEFGQFWNALVDAQSPAVKDSNQCL